MSDIKADLKNKSAMLKKMKMAGYFLIGATIVYVAFFYQNKIDKTIFLMLYVVIFFVVIFYMILRSFKKKITIEKNKISKHVEESQYSDGKIKLLLQYTPLAMAILDKDLNYVMVSDQWKSEFSIGIDNIIGMSHLSVLERFNTKQWLDVYRRALSGASICEESQDVGNDGSIKWVEWDIKPWKNNENKDGGIVLIKNDISEAKKEKQALLDKESYLLGIINNLSDGVIALNEYGVIESFNPACEQIFGYAFDEIVGKNLTEIISELYHSMHDTYFNNIRVKHESTSKKALFELEGKRKNGEVFPLELSLNLVLLDGKTILCGIARDITYLKEAERINSEFISTMTQELSTPLASIRQTVSFIVDSMMEEVPAKIQPLLKNILSNCERLIKAVNSILDVDKMASGKLTFSMQEESLALLIQKALENNRVYEEKYAVRFNVSALPSDMIIDVDASRFMQVMDNMISNAAKFSEPGKTIDISVYHVDGRYGVSIKDEGAGIAKEIKANIFKRYSKLHGRAGGEKEGSGLGLYISKNIVESMNGSIGFDSELGKGSTFWFELPAIKVVDTTLSSLPKNDAEHSDLGQQDVIATSIENTIASTANISAIPTLPKKMPRALILHIDNNDEYSQFLKLKLYPHADFIQAISLKDARRHLGSKSFNLLILSLELPDNEEIKLIHEMNAAHMVLPPILVLSDKKISVEVRQKVQKVIVKKDVSEEMLLANIIFMLEKRI